LKYFPVTGFIHFGQEAKFRQDADTDQESLVLMDPSQQFPYTSGKVISWSYFSKKMSTTQSISFSTWRPVKILVYKLQGLVFVNGTKEGRRIIELPEHKQWEVCVIIIC